MCRWVIFFPALKELEEFLGTSFLEETHEGTPYRFHLSTRDFRYLAVTVHKAACDLFELEVPSNIGVHEDFRQFTRSNDELWDKVNRIVSVPTKL